MRSNSIRDDIGGKNFGARSLQSRESHFNGDLGIKITTDIDILMASDISIKNEVFNISGAQSQGGIGLSAASCLATGAPRESLVATLSYVNSLLSLNFPLHDIWLFVGNSAIQPDTRVVRYRLLWGALKFRNIQIVGGQDFQEAIKVVSGGLKFFGAMRWPVLSVEAVVDVLLYERCSYICALPKGFDVASALEMGWVGHVSEDLDLYLFIRNEGGVIFKRVGEFDDRDWGVVAFSSMDLISWFVSTDRLNNFSVNGKGLSDQASKLSGN